MSDGLYSSPALEQRVRPPRPVANMFRIRTSRDRGVADHFRSGTAFLLRASGIAGTALATWTLLPLLRNQLGVGSALASASLLVSSVWSLERQRRLRRHQQQ